MEKQTWIPQYAVNDDGSVSVDPKDILEGMKKSCKKKALPMPNI